jgi:DNA-binding NtrC family response regulator/tetratricopeptide (TPR) repeat protein
MEQRAAHDSADHLEGSAPGIDALRAQIRHLAAFDAVGGPGVPTLLLQGETGTGKGLVARIVHDSGPRARGPFIPVNCAAIPETMLEAEVFGHEPGAFTDARRARRGLFEAAAGGTLFLDEVDSLGLALQSKLLTAIESKRIRRLGAVAERAVDVKLIAATQQDLAGLAAAGRFRPDLYHRLAVVVLRLPPLRERGDDVIVLARALLERLAAGYGARPKRLTAEAEDWLRRQPWPGNVRELGHLMERATLLHAAATVDARVLERLAAPVPGAAVPAAPRGEPSSATQGDEAREVREALARTGGNVVRAARLLGVSRDTIRHRMRRHGISRPDLEAPGETGDQLAGLGAGSPAGGGTGLAVPLAAAPPRAASWEHKPAALVAVSLAWSDAEDGAASHEPWTEHQRWARLIREKLSGLGGLPLQESPALSVWAFGLPRTVDQLLERAVHGALAIRQLAAGIGGREHGPELRVAVHHGAMLVDAAAPDPARAALAVGDTVALPVRLLGEAAAGEVVCSVELGDRVAPWARIERGDAGGRPVCRIEGLRPWRERGSSRRLTAFVGRERELGILEELMAAAEAGAGQLVGIVGPPGSGKSRLLRELRRHLEGRGVISSEAHALAHGTLTPLLPFVEMVRSYFDVTEVDPPVTVRARALSGLIDLGIDPEVEGPYLVALLGGDRPANVDGETLKRRTFDLVRRIVVAFSEKAPLLLTIENAHWLDPTSEACLAGLAEHLAAARCLFVTTYRPGYRPAWLDRSYATQIALTPLTAAESRRLIAAVAGSQPVPVTLAEQVLAWAEGNPLFLEELMRSVLEDGSTVGATIPGTVQAVIGARIDRLAPEDKRLLQVAAVIGREVPHALLERVADLGDQALHDGLVRLQAAELLVERGSRAVHTYGFKHALTQAAAYQGVPAATRGALHRRVLEALTALAGEPRPEMHPALAQHAAAGGDWARALTSYRQAGLHLLAREANREALSCFDEALAALGRLAAGQDAALGCDIRFELAEALYRTGDLGRLMSVAREAQALAETLGDQPRLAYALGMLAHWLTNEGRYDEALESGERALAICATLDLPIVQVWTRIVLGRTCLALGAYRRAAGHLRAALGTIGADGDRRYALRGVVPPSPQARSHLALALVRTGDLDEAQTLAEEALRVAEEVGGPSDRAWAHYVLGRVHHARTDWDRALPLLERAAAEGETLPAYLPRVLSGLASAYAQSGRVAEALPLLERALVASRQMRFEYGQTLIVCQLGTACVDAGRLDEAAAHATRALDTARRRGERGEEAWALLLLGDTAARRDPADIEGARAWYEQAIALGEELGMRPLVARARLAAGALERRAGRVADARRHLGIAAAEARAMGIAAWQTRAEELAR